MNFIYFATDSYLHRVSAGIKLFGLLSLSTVMILFTNWWTLGFVACLILALKFLSKLPWRKVLSLSLTYIIILLLFGAWVAWLNDWQSAVQLVVRWWFLIILTAIFLQSTALSSLVIVLEKWLYPLRWFGFSPYRISMSMVLTIRLIPYVQEVLKQIKEAQEVRGLNSSWLALIIPLCVRMITSAQSIADAMDARGFEE